MLLFYDPVIAEDGYTYERHSIEKHLKTKTTSPMTNENIEKTLITNILIRQSIQNLIEINSFKLL